MILRLIEEWEEKLDKGFFCRDSSYLRCLNAYRKSLVFFYSYLKRRKQCDNLNNIQSTFKTLLSGVPQGSIHGLINRFGKMENKHDQLDNQLNDQLDDQHYAKKQVPS